MLSFIKKVDIYKIIVNPFDSITWEGLFNFKPNSEDVATAIRKDIGELDPDVEHEAEIIRRLEMTLELVTMSPQLLGKVSIAGTYLGEISMAIVKVFAKEKQSAMPAYSPYDNPCGEVLLSDPVPMNRAQEWCDAHRKPNLTDTSEIHKTSAPEEDS
jgi:hypothetical protein